MKLKLLFILTFSVITSSVHSMGRIVESYKSRAIALKEIEDSLSPFKPKWLSGLTMKGTDLAQAFMKQYDDLNATDKSLIARLATNVILINEHKESHNDLFKKLFDKPNERVLEAYADFLYIIHFLKLQFLKTKISQEEMKIFLEKLSCFGKAIDAQILRFENQYTKIVSNL